MHSLEAVITLVPGIGINLLVSILVSMIHSTPWISWQVLHYMTIILSQR